MRVTKIALTFLAATLSYRYIEQPILSLKDRFPYEPRPSNGTTLPPSSVRRPRILDARPSSVKA
jgi:peptidoglycan/LPS O-acetylase OafA/YrhL